MIPSKNSHPQLHGRYCTCNQIQKEGGQGNTLDREGEGHGSDGTQQILLLSLLLHHMFVISDDTDAGAAADKYRYRLGVETESRTDIRWASEKERSEGATSSERMDRMENPTFRLQLRERRIHPSFLPFGENWLRREKAAAAAVTFFRGGSHRSVKGSLSIRQQFRKFLGGIII